ncbi:MAG: transcriptional repressor [Clostridia bacterium]|nr:transcriptional repressor [Clostridia bacterium]
MSGYNTEQKKMLSSFLRENYEKAYTMEDIIAELKRTYGKNAPGKSTVYRLMTHLVDEGQVKRLVKGHGRSFVYQSVKDEDCRCHLHMRCVACGRLFHLDEGLSDELLLKVRSKCGFSVSEEETILLGKCGGCN